MTSTGRTNQDPDARLDELLREAYEPVPGVAERLSRDALTAEPAGLRKRRTPWARTAALGAIGAFAALLLAAAVWLAAPSGPDTPPEPSRPETARLSITNESGTVTLTAADGTRWIAFQSEAELSGDPSS